MNSKINNKTFYEAQPTCRVAHVIGCRIGSLPTKHETFSIIFLAGQFHSLNHK